MSTADFAQFFRAACPFRAQHRTYHQSFAPNLGDDSDLVERSNVIVRLFLIGIAQSDFRKPVLSAGLVALIDRDPSLKWR